MDPKSLVSDTENQLRLVSNALTDPHAGECLLCYVYRMLEFGCTGFRWAGRYRDLRAPRATALEDRLGRMGGFCDCEIFFNAYQLRPEHQVLSQEYDGEDDPYFDDLTYPDPMPPCRGVRRGSTRGCVLWTRRRFGW